MVEILVVPDVHGRRFWEPAKAYPGEIVFLGDYTDPYPREYISYGEALEVFREITAFKIENPERVTLLIGNHELHYIDPGFETRRFSADIFPAMHEIMAGEKTRGLFSVSKQAENYLFTHAGVTEKWYERHREALDRIGGNYENRLNVYFENNPAAYNEKSTDRGGDFDSGSPLWAHFTEYGTSEPFDDRITQVVGHTLLMKQEEAFCYGNICLTDTRRLHLLKNGKLSVYG